MQDGSFFIFLETKQSISGFPQIFTILWNILFDNSHSLEFAFCLDLYRHYRLCPSFVDEVIQRCHVVHINMYEWGSPWGMFSVLFPWLPLILTRLCDGPLFLSSSTPPPPCEYPPFPRMHPIHRSMRHLCISPDLSSPVLLESLGVMSHCWPTILTLLSKSYTDDLFVVRLCLLSFYEIFL